MTVFHGPLGYSGFRVDGTGTPRCLLDGDPYKPSTLNDCAIYSQSTVLILRVHWHEKRWLETPTPCRTRTARAARVFAEPAPRTHATTLDSASQRVRPRWECTAARVRWRLQHLRPSLRSTSLISAERRFWGPWLRRERLPRGTGGMTWNWTG